MSGVCPVPVAGDSRQGLTVIFEVADLNTVLDQDVLQSQLVFHPGVGTDNVCQAGDYFPHPRCAEDPRTAVGLRKELEDPLDVRQDSPMSEASSWGLARNAVTQLLTMQSVGFHWMWMG